MDEVPKAELARLREIERLAKAVKAAMKNRICMFCGGHDLKHDPPCPIGDLLAALGESDAN